MILGCKGLTHRSDENIGFEEMTAFCFKIVCQQQPTLSPQKLSVDCIIFSPQNEVQTNPTIQLNS